jgi:hypothetical protein
MTDQPAPDTGDHDLPDLAEVEDRVTAAIRRRDAGDLRLLGHGEITIVLGWPSHEPAHALKRVPPFRDAARARTYVDACERNMAVLRDAGVALWPTTLHTLDRSDGRVVVFHRQPVADPAQVGTNVLRAAPDADAHPLLDAIVDAAIAGTSPLVGFDVQAANWVWDGSVAQQIDFSSPFVLNDQRDDLLFDTSAFLAEYPAALRPVLKRELLKLILRFTTPEGAIGDMVANLQKERLHRWVDPAIAAAARRGITIDRATTTKMFDDDRKLLPLTLKLKKAQRAWVQRTGRRYESLLPERTTYE